MNVFTTLPEKMRWFVGVRLIELHAQFGLQEDRYPMHLDVSESHRDTEYPSFANGPTRALFSSGGYLSLPCYMMDENRTSSVRETTALTCLTGTQPTSGGGGKKHPSVSPQSLLPFGG